MSIYEKNILYLKQKHPGLLDLLRSTPDSRCRTEPAKNGSLTLVYQHNGTPYYLHSKFNPQAESEKIISKKDTDTEHTVVLGLGLGYHLEKLLNIKNKFSRVLLIEPDLEIIKNSLKALDWEKVLERGNFFYVFGADFGKIAQTIHSFINIISLDTVEYIELPSETRLAPAFFTKARQVIDNEVKTNLYDFKTRLAESYMLPRNVLRNLPHILKTRPITLLKDRFAGVPGFIVSAGPSLDKNILQLKKIKDRGLLLTVDTALKPLLKRSIQPHFTAIGDPSHKNYLHLQGAENEVSHFIAAEAGIARQVFRDFKDNLFTLSIGKPMVRLIESHGVPLGELEAWGSVISIALNLAVYMGLNPIIFVGQDFAFTDTRNHCRFTSWEEKKMEYTRQLDQLQRFEKQAITGNKKVVETPDIHGNPTFTSERLILYKNYLAGMTAKYPHVRFINATEGGIFTEIPHMPLYDAIKQFVYGRSPVDLAGLRKLPQLDNKENTQRLGAFFEAKTAFYVDYLRQTEAMWKQLEAITDFSGDAVTPLLVAAETLKNDLYAVPENGEIVEMWSLAPIYHFLREYKRIEGQKEGRQYLTESVKLHKTYFAGIKPLLEDIVKEFKAAGKKMRNE